MRGGSLLRVVVLVVTLLTLASGFRPLLARKRARVSKVNMSIGSDQLMRPEDEDSPEYQEYLRQLLQLQATRGKTGFSAPSSGSADAYIAKLNRLNALHSIQQS